MAEKTALYLRMAQRNAAQGDVCRAVVTIVNTLRNNPQFLETQPEAIDFLAEILVPGYEEEIHRLATRYPSFSARLYKALAAHGKAELARQLEASFEAYCIECMKTFNASESYLQPLNYTEMPQAVAAEYSGTAAESGFFRAAPKSEKQIQICDQVQVQEPAPAALPNEVWMPSIQAEVGHLAYERHEFTSRNTDTCPSEGIRRFDRIRTHHAQTQASDYADTAADRVILDFDNSVREPPKASLFDASLTKFKSFAQEQSEWREMAKKDAMRQLGPKQTPMEQVAETTFALSDTPSVEPYSVRHPLRFKFTPQAIVTCIFACILAMIAFITWQTAEPVLQKRAIQGVSESWISAADQGTTISEEALNASKKFVDESWLNAYKQFLDVWKGLYYEGEPTQLIDPDSETFLGQYSSTHAAYIMQEVHRGHLARAKLHFDSVEPSIWREHPYFKLWSEAQLDAAAMDIRNASSKYEMLLRTPLAPFALAELGVLALDNDQADIQQRYKQHFESFETPPKLAACAYETLARSGTQLDNAFTTGRLKSPYAEYCVIANIFHTIRTQGKIDSHDIAMLENAKPLARGDYYRIEAVIQAELHEQQPDRAVAFYRSFELPEGHPLRTRLLRAILSQSERIANWGGLHALNEKIPANIGYMMAARMMDNAQTTGIVEPDGKYSESLFKYHTKLGSQGIQTIMDEALAEAEMGSYERALSLIRTVIGAHPDYKEPIYLQAMIYAQMGKADEAAALLEQDAHTGRASAVDFVIANLYRARAGLRLSPSAFALHHLTFEDPVLEGARCEILWRKHSRQAQTCLQNLSQKQELSKAIWIMSHLDNHGMPMGTAAQWAKASAGALSFPGYHLAYARKLIEEGALSESLKAYTSAILLDRSTRTPSVIDELEHIYASKQRRYEGTKKFEDIILIAEQEHWEPLILGALHKAAARLYQPEKGHSTAKQHLVRAMELIGEQPELLKSMVEYYEAKEKPEHAGMWRTKLRKAISN